MIALDNLSITFGQLVSYAIDAAFANVSDGWRHMAGLVAVPAITLCCLLPFCPESPPQLVYHHKTAEGASVIAKIPPDGTTQQVQGKVQHIFTHVEQTRSSDKSLWWQIKQLYVVPSNFRAMFAACGLMAISQLGGFNSILYYSGTLFAAVGTVIAATNFIFIWINLFLVDRVGRRQILIHTLWVMAASLVVEAICFHWVPLNHALELIFHKNKWATHVVLCIVIFVAFYSLGAGNIAWMSSELDPIEVRAVGTMLLTMSCWGSNVTVASTFLTSGAFWFLRGRVFLRVDRRVLLLSGC